MIIIKKYIILLGILLTVSIISTLVIDKLAVDKQVVFIDAGHGGIDSGANYEEYREDEINLSIAFKLKEKLEFFGYEVIMSRTEDEDLATTEKYSKLSDIDARVNMVNESDADLMISIHCNFIKQDVWRGAQTFYANENSKKLAKSIQDNMVSMLGNTDRVHKKVDYIYLLNKIEIPGVVLESGFISNKEERELLGNTDYQDKIAEGLLVSVVDYFND